MTRFAFAFLLAGCATAAQQGQPEIHITQLSNVSEAARHITGGLSVQYKVDVINRAATPITIKRIDVISLGSGAYSVRPTSYPVDKAIAAGESAVLQFWVPAKIDDPTIVGANGPVSLRVTLQYETPAGMTQAIVVQQVNALSGVN